MFNSKGFSTIFSEEDTVETIKEAEVQEDQEAVVEMAVILVLDLVATNFKKLVL